MRLNRRLTFPEELGNTITHGVMSAATLVLLPIENSKAKYSSSTDSEQVP